MTKKLYVAPGEQIEKAAQRAVNLVEVGHPSVSFDFNDIVLTVASGMSASDVVAEYWRQSEVRRAAYEASPEYKERQRQAEVREQERASRLEDKLAQAPAAMTIKSAEAWEKWHANNTDGYGAAILRYAELWARTMEGMIAGGATLTDCAEKASHLADSEGITGFMYGAAVSVLADVWVHGDELRRWHNWKHGVTEEKAKGATVNPAVLSVGGK